MTSPQIMIVEDELIVAKNIEISLRKAGYEVPAIVSSGEEAIQQAGQLRPNLILMDIRLQGEMLGVEAAEQIHTRFDIPVVYLTAYADEASLRGEDEWVDVSHPHFRVHYDADLGKASGDYAATVLRYLEEAHGDAAARLGLASIIQPGDAAQQRDFLELGFSVISCGGDYAVYREALAAAVADVRKAVGGSQGRETTSGRSA